MLDFIKIVQSVKKGSVEIYPKFKVCISKDLMIRGGGFYAIWNDKAGLWTTDEFIAMEMIDEELDSYYREHKNEFEGTPRIMHLWDADTGMVDKWHKFCEKQMPENYHALDEKVIFLDTPVKREDYASKRLGYPLVPGPTDSYDYLMDILYAPEERRKIEWAIGAILSGDSIRIQKFLVFYGSAGTGKSTVLNIIQKLFDGYYAAFDAKALGSKSDSFALEPFSNNPLVAIQHDGDLSRIEDNTRLNSIVSHELMTINQKFKSLYSARINSFLLMGTNKPVKITDAKSGLIRRLIDVRPTGNKLPYKEYTQCMSRIDFELGGIACHCLDVYKEDPNYYDNYIPTNMMGASNVFYDFMVDSADIFMKQDSTTLQQAWELYKAYSEDAKIEHPMIRMSFKEELKNYFREFDERKLLPDGERIRNYYEGFLADKFFYTEEKETSNKKIRNIVFKEQHSKLDDILSDCKAQYASEQETPLMKWDNVSTKLRDLDTSRLHYVRVPKNHIVIDFDIKDKSGNKSYKKNLEEASKWPETYAELSKSGSGIHLHYIYDGDVDKLSRLFGENIEIKVFSGKSSLRRKLTKCNDKDIAVINSGLPLKGDTKVVNINTVKSEKALRTLIYKNLNKEIHPGTKPSIDFIEKILNDAYADGLKYDVSDLQPKILAFAANSTNHAKYCIELVGRMKFKSEDPSENNELYLKNELVFFDVEVYPNLFIVVWKTQKGKPVKMINPSSIDIENLIKFKLVGFNCRRYDNHILYARLLGYDNAQLYEVSQKIINGSRNAFFGEAYNISYTDVYDFSSKKQSLKKFEIELGIHHQEMGIPWDQPVDESLWTKVAEYCCNDVIATQAVFEDRHGDWIARQILADVAEMSVNDTTNSLTTRIIFGTDRHPNLVYTDLSKDFPGYRYVSALDSEDGKPHNIYMGEDVGFGGYVYADPGMYGRTVTFDVASMHPSSIVAMNCFGKYTQQFEELLQARIAIKHKDFELAKKMLNGKLAKHLESEEDAKALSQALKIAINSVYGLTSATFDNPFKDPRNVNNIVALRGALFMVSLKNEIQKMGYKVVHIKTDSIKIADPSSKVYDFVMKYGKKYGYNFEVEHVFEKICLVNNAVYIAKCAEDDPDTPGKWEATGKQFQIPYVFKSLFSKEPITVQDCSETKEVKTALYLDMNENLPQGEHNYCFVGKVGLFCPIKSGYGAGELMRLDHDKYSYAVGSKGYRWLEYEQVIAQHKEKYIDTSYYVKLVDEAVESISSFGDFEWFIS